VTSDGLLGIGAFALLSGLSIPALRHYDDVGLLKPALVDPRSGYRRYQTEQVRAARVIGALRRVDMSVDQIRHALASEDGEPLRTVLVRHREELFVRRRTIAQMLSTLDEYIEKGVPMGDTRGCRVVEVNLGVDDLGEARRFFEAAFGVECVEERHGDGPLHLYASFGKWPSDQFFLLNISDANRDPARTGKANFGLVVDDLDVVHRRAVAAGASEIVPPADEPGMPRCSMIEDPSGNRINLYENA
jgi:DNA-binding transcriptional MerR regulator